MFFNSTYFTLLTLDAIEEAEIMRIWRVKYFFVIASITAYTILGDPGATSRDDTIFSGESLLQALEVNFHPKILHRSG